MRIHQTVWQEPAIGLGPPRLVGMMLWPARSGVATGSSATLVAIQTSCLPRESH
jgi:hypothetical protein